jgi:hypothetical protein
MLSQFLHSLLQDKIITIEQVCNLMLINSILNSLLAGKNGQNRAGALFFNVVEVGVLCCSQNRAGMYIYICICVCVYIYIYTCMHMFVVCVSLCACECVHGHAFFIYTYIYMQCTINSP